MIYQNIRYVGAMRPIETCVDDTNERLYIFIIVEAIADVNTIL